MQTRRNPIIRPNSLSAFDTFGNSADGRESCWHSGRKFLVRLSLQSRKIGPSFDIFSYYSISRDGVPCCENLLLLEVINKTYR